MTHALFVVGIGLMVLNLHQGMRWGRGSFTGWAAAAANAALLLQFPVVHSLLLRRNGRALMARILPFGLGTDLVTTTFALIGSLQLLLTFACWSPSGIVWWEPSGTAAWASNALFGASWLLLGLALRDAGLPLHTGSLGWTAAARGRQPVYRRFSERGLFRLVRQPVYLGFALTMWTGPVWTPDRLVLALTWTAYCIAGPLLKERRYLSRFGPDFRSYQQRVPFMMPFARRRPVLAPAFPVEPSRAAPVR